LAHSFLAYLPISLTLNRGYDWNVILFGGLISILYVSLLGIMICSVNDFFDRDEDLTYKPNPFDEDNETGLVFILTLLVLSLLVSFLAAFFINFVIIIFSGLAIMLSWLYSDNTYVKRIIGFRLKSHCSTEMLSIVLGYLLIFASSLAITQVLILEAAPLLILTALDYASVTIRKDIWDVPKDYRADNKTIPVIWGLSRAFKLMDSISFASFFALAYFSIVGFLPFPCTIGVIWIPLRIILRNHDWIYYKTRLFGDINPFFLFISLGMVL